MSAATKLEYGSRFGTSVARVAKASTLAQINSAHDAAAPPRYTRWFHGEDGTREPMATSAKKFRKVDPSMAAAEVAAITKENMAILGGDACELFVSRLPREHRLRKAIRSAVLPSAPYLGLCKFGEVLSERVGDNFHITQIFITNFDGNVGTDDNASLCVPISNKFDQMLFGVHVIVDRLGNRIGFDRSRGNDGLAFKTKNIGQALYHIASESTGLSLEDLQVRAAAAARKTDGPAA
jgi:hypothetical protein